MVTRIWIALAAALVLHAQGTTPKPSPSEYPVYAVAGHNEIGAEYMVHSFSAGEAMYIAENYLVVEVAFYPPGKKDPIAIDAAKLGLRVNGKKVPLVAQNPSLVAANLNHRDWQMPRGPQGDVGYGGIGVGMGGPRTQPPFPGGPDRNRLPNPPRSPDADPNVPPKEQEKPEEVLMKTALPNGVHEGPVSGFVYFPWQGKASSIKSLELIYDGTSLKLR